MNSLNQIRRSRKLEPLRIDKYNPVLDPSQERDFNLRELIRAKNEAISNIATIINQRINSINNAYIRIYNLQNYRINEETTSSEMNKIDIRLSDAYYGNITKSMDEIKKSIKYYDQLTKRYIELLQNEKTLLDPVERNTNYITEIPKVTRKGKLPEALGTEVASYLIDKPVGHIEGNMTNVYNTLAARDINKEKNISEENTKVGIGGKRKRKKYTRKNKKKI